MGTLGGHLLPGSFFIIFSIWWGFITSIRYIQSRQRLSQTKKNKDSAYRGSVTMPCVFLPTQRLRNAPVESYLKLVLAFIALVIEGYTGYKILYVSPDQIKDMNESTHSMSHDHHKRSADHHLIRKVHFEKGNAQHITMYSAFIFGSVIEIMMHYGVELPKKLDYAMGAMAFAVEAFLFAFHLHGKEPIDVYLHVLLVYAIVACIFFCFLEAYNPKQVLFTYGRILFTMLQGTWFYQVGFMLYPPTDNPAFKWDLNDHGSIMTITVTYCWHVMLIIFGLLMQYFFVKKIFFRSNYGMLKSHLNELIYSDNKNLNESKSEMRFLTIDSETEDSELENESKNIKKLNGNNNHKFAISDDNNL